MKKAFTAIAALALTIGAASALSFSWGTSTQITWEGTVLNTAALAAPVTANLIFLGADGAWSFDELGVPTDEAVSTGSVAISGGSPTAKGKASGKITKSAGNILPDGSIVGADTFADGTAFGGGNVFGVLITYTDTEGKVWYNLSANTYTLANGVSDITTITKQNFDFSWAKDESDADTPTAGGGWWTAPAVPEPVSGGLALAGLALLLKRRRA